MTEPFLYTLNNIPDDSAYYEIAPVQFKNPNKSLYLIPLTSKILASTRGFYTKEEIDENKSIIKSAYDNTAKNQLRKNTDNDFISIRSNKTDIPCAATFMTPNRHRLFKAIEIDITDYYIIFITADEVLLAEKATIKPTQIRKVLNNIKNKMTSLFPQASPVLTTTIFVYNMEDDCYVEI